MQLMDDDQQNRVFGLMGQGWDKLRTNTRRNPYAIVNTVV